MDQYRSSNRKKTLFIVGFLLLATISVAISLGFGVYKISLADALITVFNHITNNVTDERSDWYIWYIRLPRALGGLLVGAGLGIAGTIMQNDFKNPLAEPYTMGISSGAFLGAVFSIILGFSIIPFIPLEYATVTNAFIMALVPTAIIVIVTRFKKLTPTAMILTGIAVMFLFSSICQYIMVSAPSESMADAYAWRVGTLAKIDWESLQLIVLPVVVISFVLWFLAGKINIMYAGDKGAKTMGEDAPRLRIVTLVLVSLLTATVVSVSGTIGFIGLVGPHVARIFVGSNNKYLIPASAAFGAAFIILADTIAKVSGANGLPVGVISSMIGGPLFIWILIKQRRNVWA